VWDGNLAGLVTALLYLRNLVFELDGTGTCFNHLLGEKISGFLIAEACVDIGNDRHNVGLEIVYLVDQGLFLNLVARLIGVVQGSEKPFQFDSVSLFQKGVNLMD